MGRRWPRFVAALVLLAGCRSTQPADAPAGWVVQSLPTADCTVARPPDWDERTGPTGPITLASPAGADDDFPENVTIVLETPARPLTSRKYAAANLRAMSDMLERYVKLGEETIRIDGRPMVLVTSTYHVGSQPIKALAGFVTDGSRAWTLTCSATPDSFDRYRPLFRDILTSFRPGGEPDA